MQTSPVSWRYPPAKASAESSVHDVKTAKGFAKFHIAPISCPACLT